MINVLLYSENEVFSADLKQQINRFVEDVSFTETIPDVIIVDEDVAECANFRSKYESVPIIFLTASSEKFISNYLNINIKKPFVLGDLIDDVKSANNRLDSSKEGFLVFNDYELHPSKKEIFDFVSRHLIKLTEREVDILKYMYKNADGFVDKNELQRNVWQYSDNVSTHTIETHIYRLRQKIEKYSNRKLIITENGRYRLCL